MNGALRTRLTDEGVDEVASYRKWSAEVDANDRRWNHEEALLKGRIINPTELKATPLVPADQFMVEHIY